MPIPKDLLAQTSTPKELKDFLERTIIIKEVIVEVSPGKPARVETQPPGVDRYGNYQPGEVVSYKAEPPKTRTETQRTRSLHGSEIKTLYQDLINNYLALTASKDEKQSYKEKLLHVASFAKWYYPTDILLNIGQKTIQKLMKDIEDCTKEINQCTPEEDQKRKSLIQARKSIANDLLGLSMGDERNLKLNEQQKDRIFELVPECLLGFEAKPSLALIETAIEQLSQRESKEDPSLMALQAKHTAILEEVQKSLRNALIDYTAAITAKPGSHTQGQAKIAQLKNAIDNIKNLEDIQYLIKENIQTGLMKSSGFKADSLNKILMKHIVEDNIFEQVFPNTTLFVPQDKGDLGDLFKRMGIENLPTKRAMKAQSLEERKKPTVYGLADMTHSTTFGKPPRADGGNPTGNKPPQPAKHPSIPGKKKT